jgi:hypothetical protein
MASRLSPTATKASNTALVHYPRCRASRRARPGGSGLERHRGDRAGARSEG